MIYLLAKQVVVDGKTHPSSGVTSTHSSRSCAPSCRNGIPKSRSNSRASSSLSVEVTSVIFMPWTRVNLSGFNSGNTNCSVRPRL